MASRSKVRIVLDRQALAELLTEEEARNATLVAGRAFAQRARRYAARSAVPGPAGHGGDSFTAQIVDNYTGGAAFAALVSWDRLHWYMKFPEFGTIHQLAHPALQPALDDYAQF